MVGFLVFIYVAELTASRFIDIGSVITAGTIV